MASSPTSPEPAPPEAWTYVPAAFPLPPATPGAPTPAAPDDSNRPLWTVVAGGYVAMAIIAASIALAQRLTPPAPHATRAAVAAADARALVARGRSGFGFVDRNAGPSVVRHGLATVGRHLPQSADVRAIVVTELGQTRAVAVARDRRAVNVSTDDPRGLEIRLTPELAASSPIRLRDVDVNAPATMLHTILLRTGRDAPDWESTTLQSVPGHPHRLRWTATWSGTAPATFTADAHGRHVRLTEGPLR